jgi:hypothetical protein
MRPVLSQKYPFYLYLPPNPLSSPVPSFLVGCFGTFPNDFLSEEPTTPTHAYVFEFGLISFFDGIYALLTELTSLTFCENAIAFGHFDQ